MGRKRYYAIAAGWKTGIFQEPWEKVQHYVFGFKNAAYKGFQNLEEAKEFMKTGAEEVLQRSCDQKKAAQKLRGRRRGNGISSMWE